ncbi:hypothetical protein CWR48_13950 [Oceanobacillus arenosus]|uniref:Uncharacterized protein n=1 Tax=Oceanobacillus arenosus TaxID=1229153 RepID=A0A3D8PRM3_9BACI|nr:hypothetical protein [Oceanobacillus arenosus]RDW17615.1 hypothetical protein CWR48_13950 [Oceanobacillus arenosus]
MPNLQSYKLSAIARGDKELVGIIEQAERVDELEERNAFLEKAHRINVNIAENVLEERNRFKQAIEKASDELGSPDLENGVLRADRVLVKALKGEWGNEK